MDGARNQAAGTGSCCTSRAWTPPSGRSGPPRRGSGTRSSQVPEASRSRSRIPTGIPSDSTRRPGARSTRASGASGSYRGVRMEVDPLTGLEVARRGLYVHFPYCLRRCPYCDFTIAIAHSIPGARYADAVLGELRLRLAERPAWTERPLDSVYLGGGTPSLWEAREVARVLEGIGRE